MNLYSTVFININLNEHFFFGGEGVFLVHKWFYQFYTYFGSRAELVTKIPKSTPVISPAFWLVSGSEFKITRNDDSGHTLLLQTTGNCLSGKIFRCKITSYGDFSNGSAWSGGKCLGKCNVQFGGRYLKTKISNWTREEKFHIYKQPCIILFII